MKRYELLTCFIKDNRFNIVNTKIFESSRILVDIGDELDDDLSKIPAFSGFQSIDIY